MIGYQIMVHERREDPEDWTCQCNLNDSWRYNNKVYLNKEEAEKKRDELEETDSVHSYGGFDFGYRTFEVVTCEIS